MAPCNGATSTPPKLVMAPSNGTTSTPQRLVVTLPTTMAPCTGTQQWHHVRSPKVGRHPPPNRSTPQWHPAMAPRPLPQSWPSPSPHHSTLQWHPAMAPRPLPQSWSSPSPTIAHYNGTLRWHPAMAPRPLHPAMAPWCHVQSAKVVRRPHPLLEVRTPIAIAIWEKQGPPNLNKHFPCPTVTHSQTLKIPWQTNTEKRRLGFPTSKSA